MKRSPSTILITLLFCLILRHTNAQNLYFKHLGINDGLSQVCIPSIYEDETGAMWIGTSEGVNRYNGVSMTKFQENRNDEVWPSKDVTKITGNKNGLIYVISGESLISISLRTGRTQCLREKGVNDIFSGRDTLWCACNDGIFYYANGDATPHLFTRRPPKMYQFTRIHIKGEQLYAATPASLFVMDRNNPQRQRRIADIGHNILHIYVDRQENIWLGTWNGAYRISPAGKMTNFNSSPQKGGISHNQVRCITEDNYGNIWLGTFMGLDCYKHASSEWKHFTQYGDSPNTLSHTSILSLCTDSKGNIWAGTYYGGVNIFNPDPNAGYFYHAAPLRNDWLNFSVVGKMAEDHAGNIWICTEGGGMNILSLQDGYFKHLKHIPGNPATPGSNNLKSIYFHPDNQKMYIGAHWGGLYIYDTAAGRGHCIKNSGEPNSLPHDIVNDIAPYNEGLILLTQGGVVYLDIRTEAIRRLPVNPEAEKVLGKSYTYETLTLDSRDRLWLGHTAGGVTCVDLNSSHVEYFPLDSTKKSKVAQIYEDPRGEIYVCTLGSGLFHYVNYKNLFTPHSLANGRMPNDYCYYACSTRRPGHLYVLNGNGISLFDTSEEKAVITNRVFNQSYSLGSAIFRSDSGKLYIGGTNGLAVIGEEIFSGHNHKNPVVPDRLFIYNREIVPGDSTRILKNALPYTKRIKLSYRMNHVTVEFSSFDYIDNIHHPYEYFLEGFDNSWNLADGKRITYTNLPPGNYTLKARNIIPNREEEAPISHLEITITPPFYASTPAYLLYGLAVLLLTGFIIRAIIRQATLRTSLIYERNEKDRMKELTRMKIDFFTNISHELRTPLTLILVQLEGLIHYESLGPSIVNKLRKVYKNAQNLLNLSAELTDFEKQANGKIKAEELDIVGYTKQIYSSFRELARKKRINCHFSSSANLINIWFDPKQMYKALYSLMGNAIKLGESTGDTGAIYTSIRRAKSEVMISITNAGVCLPLDKLEPASFSQEEGESTDTSVEYSGIGLSIVRKIVEMHHGSMTVESSPEKGTTVTISLLTGNHHFSPDELKENDNDRVIVSPEDGTTDNMPIKASEEEIETIGYDDRGESHKPEILLIEDNKELCQVLKDVLQPTYTLHVAHNGTEGFNMASSIHPDLVICDLQLPGMSGKELCYKIKNNVGLSDISIIVTTNSASTESMVETLLMGADDYMAKPFDVRLLYARIRSILNNKRRLVAWCGNNVRTTTSEADAISESDKKFLKKCIEIIRDNFENPDFDVTILANELCMGRSTFYTKFKQIVGIPPNEFIAKIKLEEAMNLLKENPDLNISEVSIRLGFSSPRYFSRMFKSFFGVTPQSVRK